MGVGINSKPTSFCLVAKDMVATAKTFADHNYDLAMPLTQDIPIRLTGLDNLLDIPGFHNFNVDLNFRRVMTVTIHLSNVFVKPC
jgi:hypothetical protein